VLAVLPPLESSQQFSFAFFGRVEILQVPTGTSTRAGVCLLVCCCVAVVVLLACLLDPVHVLSPSSLRHSALSPMASSLPKGYDPTLGQKQRLQDYLNENEEKGAPVHSFNPDASPQEKAAIAGKAQSQLQSIKQQQQNFATSAPLPCLSPELIVTPLLFARPSRRRGRNCCARGAHRHYRRRRRKARAAEGNARAAED
jgi:hypothetical protein